MSPQDFLPIPELEVCKRLLCIQPHPDDNEVGAGATIAKLASLGCEITYLTVTDGSKGTYDPNQTGEELANIRLQEATEAAALLGVTHHRFLGFEDGGYASEKELCNRIISVIREVKPEIIMTVDPFLLYEGHPDHRRVGMAAAEACLFSNMVSYRTGRVGQDEPWSVSGIAFHTTAHPNTIINVDATWELKNKAILTHKSQFEPESFQFLQRYFDYKAQEYAKGKGFERGEAFKVLTPTHLHMSVDTMYV